MIGPRITITRQEDEPVDVDLYGRTISFHAQIKKGAAEICAGRVTVDITDKNFRALCRTLLAVRVIQVDGGAYRCEPKNSLRIKQESLIFRD